MSYMESIDYNQIDFIIKAPRFKIIFSYMDEKGIPFVREYFLRLLKIKPCKPEHIAEYFDFSERETEVALKDLLDHKWVKWNLDGTIGLSNEGLSLFDGYSNEPKISSLRQSSAICNVEFLAKNFVKKEWVSGNSQFSIELEVPTHDLSISKDIVKQQFSKDFISLLENKIIEIPNEDAELYKVDLIEQYSIEYFRIVQNFKIAADSGNQIERNNINVQRTEEIDLRITEKITQLKPNKNNLKDILSIMDQLNDQDTRSIIVNDKLDINKFIELQQYSNDIYFVGQICQQKYLIKKVEEEINNSENLEVLKWLGPSDIYWGKQIEFKDLIQRLVDGEVVTRNKEKRKLYNFRMYLPLPNDNSVLEQNIREIDYHFRGLSKDHLYLYNEGFLGGNVEIMVLEGSFAIVCYHIKLPDNYDVTLPIGFMTTDKDAINLINIVVDNYLKELIFDDDSNFEMNDFGAISKIRSKISNRG